MKVASRYLLPLEIVMAAQAGVERAKATSSP